jgi:putative salt-induced outer membrane protein YdiY
MFSRFTLHLTAILILFFSATGLKAQVDSLVMNTGEVLAGEIKGLKQGIVTIETDYSDSDFKVEWLSVSSIITERKYIVLLSNGDRFHGTLKRSEETGKARLNDAKYGFLTVDIFDVVFLKAIDEDFLSRIDLLMSIGYSLTKENESHQFSTRINADYTSSKFGADIYFNAVRTLQKPDSITISTRRTEGGAGIRFFIVRDWFALANADFLQSTEQKLDLRSLVKLGVGNMIVNTNTMYLVLSAGIGGNIENYNDPGSDDRNSIEGFAGVEYNIFDIGDLELRTSVVGYPSITENGRFRSDFNFDLKYDFPLDFFINLGFTLNYDNKPVEGASTNDYVLQTTFGWEL